MTGITFLLLAAAVGFGISRRFGIPAIPLLIACGFLAARFLPLPGEFLESALMLGLTVMVFVAGMELNPERARGQEKAAFQVGLIQFLVLGAIGMVGALALGYSVETGTYVALALSASSTLVVVRLLQSRGQFFEPFGRLVTGVLLLQDILVIMAIPVVTRLPEGAGAVARGLLAIGGLLVLSGVILRWIAPFAVRVLRRDEETILLVVLAILFSFLGLAYLFELPLVVGAFMAGLSLSGFPVAALLRGNLGSISDFFGALFFTALGAFLPLPDGTAFLHALALSALVILVTPPLVALVAERAGFSARPALAAGLLLSQTSEFSLVVGLQGVVIGQLAPEVFGVIVLTTILTMILTPFLATDRITWALMRRHPLRGRARLEKRPENHVLLLGAGRNGGTLLEMLIVTPCPLVVVDDDPALIGRIREAGVPVLRGDASDVEILREAGADRARIVVSTIRRREDNAPLLAMAHRVPVLVRAFNLEDGEWIRQRGGSPVLYSDAAARDFFDWYENEWLERNTDPDFR
jgi:monovalent cation:H+ antiporter-2, CPA2 family